MKSPAAAYNLEKKVSKIAFYKRNFLNNKYSNINFNMRYLVFIFNNIICNEEWLCRVPKTINTYDKV